MPITFEPYKTQGIFYGNFNVNADGYMQGDAQDDPAISQLLNSGMIGSTVTATMWGGLGIIEALPNNQSYQEVLGSQIYPASATTCNGFTVFNQAYNGVITPGFSVPLFSAGDTIHYYRLGSGARIPLKISAGVIALASQAANTIIPVNGESFVWDTENLQIDLASSSSAGNPVVNIDLLTISPPGNNHVVTVNSSGLAQWDLTQAIGLFKI